ncbi:MAG: hypothetical protein KKA42_08015 [candidate division Zixibacteria bacterium]|nr:hypothetical protein [candidate division Zixibacteria bacterium]
MNGRNVFDSFRVRITRWFERLSLLGQQEQPTIETREYWQSAETILPGDELSRPYCTHSRLRQVVARLIGRLQGRPDSWPIIDRVCPVCGLRARGDLPVVYVLQVWFVDGICCEYHFPGRRVRDCYRIHNGVLHINMGKSVVAYSMDVVSTVSFEPREIPLDSPEVAEAERIIAGDSPDE